MLANGRVRHKLGGLGGRIGRARAGVGRVVLGKGLGRREVGLHTKADNELGDKTQN